MLCDKLFGECDFLMIDKIHFLAFSHYLSIPTIEQGRWIASILCHTEGLE